MAPTKATKKSRPKSKATGPAEIAPGVYVGGWKEAVAFTGTRFCVLDEAPPDMPVATHVRIYDEASERADLRALDRVADQVAKAQKTGAPVLIFCGRGAMRSPLAAMWYLHRAQGVSLDEAFQTVHAGRSQSVHPKEWVANLSELLAA